LSGGNAIIGDPSDNHQGVYAGAAYVFRFDGRSWREEQKLIPPDLETNDHFGRSVSLSGEVAAVGVPYDSVRARGSGSVYVYRFDGAEWIELEKISPADGAAYDGFGGYVAMDGTTAIFTAGGDDIGDYATGSAYVYRLAGTQAGPSTVIPAELVLAQNYPNPFKQWTVIRFGLPTAASVTLEVFDLSGRRVMRVLEGAWYPRGSHDAVLRLDGFAPGVYMYRLSADGVWRSGTMLFVR
jgi:hypothetical protein